MSDINNLVLVALSENTGSLGGEMYNSWNQYPSQQYDSGGQNQISSKQTGDRVVNQTNTDSDYATYKSLESYQKPPAPDSRQEPVKKTGGFEKNYAIDNILNHAIRATSKRQVPVIKSPNVNA